MYIYIIWKKKIIIIIPIIKGYLTDAPLILRMTFLQYFLQYWTFPSDQIEGTCSRQVCNRFRRFSFRLLRQKVLSFDESFFSSNGSRHPLIWSWIHARPSTFFVNVVWHNSLENCWAIEFFSRKGHFVESSIRAGIFFTFARKCEIWSRFRRDRDVFLTSFQLWDFISLSCLREVVLIFLPLVFLVCAVNKRIARKLCSFFGCCIEYLVGLGVVSTTATTFVAHVEPWNLISVTNVGEHNYVIRSLQYKLDLITTSCDRFTFKKLRHI